MILWRGSPWASLKAYQSGAATTAATPDMGSRCRGYNSTVNLVGAKGF
jgi:hypothetical protein